MIREDVVPGRETVALTLDGQGARHSKGHHEDHVCIRSVLQTKVKTFVRLPCLSLNKLLFSIPSSVLLNAAKEVERFNRFLETHPPSTVLLALVSDAIDGGEVSVTRIASALVVGTHVGAGAAEPVVVLGVTIIVCVEGLEPLGKVTFEFPARNLAVGDWLEEEVPVAVLGVRLTHGHRIARIVIADVNVENFV